MERMAITPDEVEEARGHLMRWLHWHMLPREDGEPMTQQDLAEALGVSPPTITFWLRGKGSLPAFPQLLSIAKELRLPLDVLLKRDPPEYPPT